jgi:hypothetical protein
VNATRTMSARLRIPALLVAALALAGCSVLTVNPAFEVVKLAGAVVSSTIATGPSSARNSVFHEHPAIASLCVEYNPHAPDPDIAPALQQELKLHEIDSRVYDGDAMPPSCRYRLTYTAAIDWGVPPLGSGYQAYLRDATLTLRDRDGLVLASSAYDLDGPFQMGKWAPSRSKIAPMVTQLVTGFDR